MKILVVGGGGREHAIIKKPEKKPPRDGRFTPLPGNGGIAADASLRAGIEATDIDGIAGLRQGQRH